ncbi:TPA: hypothetical protein ACYDAF_005455, partial [Escherichia coli]
MSAFLGLCNGNPRLTAFALQKRAQTLSNALFCIEQWFCMFWLVQAVRGVLSAFLTMVWLLFVVCG